MVRYLDGRIVSTKGERFTEIKKEDTEELKKTFINLKPAKKYRFHWYQRFRSVIRISYHLLHQRFCRNILWFCRYSWAWNFVDFSFSLIPVHNFMERYFLFLHFDCTTLITSCLASDHKDEENWAGPGMQWKIQKPQQKFETFDIQNVYIPNTYTECVQYRISACKDFYYNARNNTYKHSHKSLAD